MSTKRNIDKIVDLNETVEECKNEESKDAYASIENAFTRMKKMQQKMTMQKISEMEKSLSKLEQELNNLIETHSGE